jgi:hypothetical protein
MLRSSRAVPPCFVAGLLFALLFAVWGCGGSGPDNLVPVSGKVTIDGKTLTKGTVSYRPDKSQGNSSTEEPYGEISADGTYTLYTGAGEKKRKGAPVGKYHVLVEANEGVPPGTTATPKPIVNLKYSDPSKPLLHREVVENPKDGQYDLQVHR